jgi:hypothetical protein
LIAPFGILYRLFLSRETDNIGYTRHRTKINVREYRRGKSIIDNLEKLAI